MRANINNCKNQINNAEIELEESKEAIEILIIQAIRDKQAIQKYMKQTKDLET